MRGARRLSALLLVLAVVLGVGALAVTRLGSDTAPATTAPATPSAPVPTTSAPPSTSPTVRVEGESTDSSAPERVRVPRAGIDVGTERLRIDDQGRLQSPRGWQRAGWYAAGPAPGDVGPAVVAGHVDSPTGPAAFTGLSAVRPGDVVEVDRADGSTVDFAVDRLQVVAKDDFPTAAVYGPTPDRQLRLVTCDGPYVRADGGYQDNLVVFATAVDQ